MNTTTTTTVGALEALVPGGRWAWMDGAVDGAGLWMHAASGRVASVQWVGDRLVAAWSV